MKAGILDSIEHLVVRELPTPELQSGSVLIRVRACSVCTTDVLTYRFGNPRIKLPHILGHEIAGEVETVSSEVDDYRVGDRVAITPKITCGKCYYCTKGLHTFCQSGITFEYELPGGYADYLLVPPRGVKSGVLNKFAEDLSFEEASLAEPLSCCLRAQKSSQVGYNDSVVIIGGGPVGIMHCRLAKVNGAYKTILIENETKRLEHVDLSSIDMIIDSSKSDYETDVKAATGGRGANVVIVACSSAEAQEKAFSLVDKGGKIILFGGLYSGQSTISVDSNLIHYYEVSVSGTHGTTPGYTREALDMLAKKELNVSDIITDTFPLDSIETAFHLAEKRQGMRMTICP